MEEDLNIVLGAHTVQNAQNTDCSVGPERSWSLSEFQQQLRVDVVTCSFEELEFDLVGVDAAIANAIRRVLLAEVPSIAIEKVYIRNNTSVIQDEVLAHRLGLIPIFADPRKFRYPVESDDVYSNPSHEHIVEFQLKVKCLHNPKAPNNSQDPDELYIHSKITTDDLKWVPIGNQSQMFKVFDVRPVHNDVLIAKLRPGQELDLRMLCVKGIGRDHSKFSPVATASYRLLPEITLLKPIVGPLADKLARCFPAGVISVHNVHGQRQATVRNARLDTCSREVLRHEDLKDCVQLTRTRNHFIFLVESVGALSADTLVLQALQILMDKCTHFLGQLDVME